MVSLEMYLWILGVFSLLLVVFIPGMGAVLTWATGWPVFYHISLAALGGFSLLGAALLVSKFLAALGIQPR